MGIRLIRVADNLYRVGRDEGRTVALQLEPGVQMNSDDKVDVTIKLTAAEYSRLSRISELSGVPIGEVFNVILAISLVQSEEVKP